MVINKSTKTRAVNNIINTNADSDKCRGKKKIAEVRSLIYLPLTESWIMEALQTTI